MSEVLQLVRVLKGIGGIRGTRGSRCNRSAWLNYAACNYARSEIHYAYIHMLVFTWVSRTKNQNPAERQLSSWVKDMAPLGSNRHIPAFSERVQRMQESQNKTDVLPKAGLCRIAQPQSMPSCWTRKYALPRSRMKRLLAEQDVQYSLTGRMPVQTYGSCGKHSL